MTDNTGNATNNGNETSSQASLEDIDESLRNVEDNLMTGNRGVGRAFFNSVNSMLSSLRERLDHHDVQSSSSRDAANLSERLQTAEFAHSHRIPLDVLRSTHFLPVRTAGGNSVSFRTATTVLKGEEEKSPEEEKEHATENNTEFQPQQVHRIFRRTSSLVASRVQADALGDADMDLHEESAMMLLTYVGETSELISSQSGDGISMEMSVEVTAATAAPQVLPPAASASDYAASAANDDHLLPPPILLPRLSMQRLPSLSRSISGSMSLTSEKKSETNERAIYSWGPASSHSLHDDGLERSLSQAKVAAECRVNRTNGLLSVALGPRHSAYATAQGQVYTCGENSTGAVDPFRKDLIEVERPTMMESLCNTIVQQVSCGWDHTAALTSTGAVLTWGSNEEGQLGHFHTAQNSPDPNMQLFCRPKVMVLGPRNPAASIACGDKFTLVLTTKMAVFACGVATIAGFSSDQTLTNETPSTKLPSELPALVGLPIAFISAGKDHAVALTAHGSAYAWGKNSTGCCGRPVPEEIATPVPIQTPVTCSQPSRGDAPFPNWSVWQTGAPVSLADDVAVVHAACGHDHTVLVTRAGGIFVCGSNRGGQLGIETKADEKQVRAVEHPSVKRRFTAAEAGESNTLLLDDIGDVWQMGTETAGILKRVLTQNKIVTIAAGGHQSIAVADASATNHTFSMTEGHNATADASGKILAHSLETLVERVSNEMQTDGDCLSEEATELVERTEELLKSPAVMNSLFLDPSELNVLFEEITKVDNPQLQEALAVATEKSIEMAVKSLQSSGARMIYPEAVRCLLHYLRFFDRSEESSTHSFDVSGSCIMSLCEAILGLPYEGFKAILAWMSFYPRELFVPMLVKPLLSQLSRSLRVVVDADGVQHRQVSQRAVPLIVSVLRWLHHASERAGNAQPSDFYSEAVGRLPLETLFEDLRAHKMSKKQKSSTSLICTSPFLIPPSTKRDLLQIESQMYMMNAATQDALIDARDGTMTIDPFFVIEIKRDHLLEQTLDKMRKAGPLEIRKKIRVKFTGEEGIDAGGVTKEFFQLLSEALFDISSGLWTRRFGDEITWFNTNCTWDLEGYELVGMLVGVAVYNGVLLDVRFPPALYRMWLDISLGLEDLVDEELKKGLQQLLDYEGDDVEDIFCLTFEVTSEDMGAEQKVELKPGGASIPVTSTNKEEYVLLYVKWILVDSIQLQWGAFRKGLLRVTEGVSLDLFRPEELELLVVGSPELDFSALKENAEYEGGYTKESPVVKNLWRFVKNSDCGSQEKLLKFTTGTSKAPIGGLGAMQFKVQRDGPDSMQLPTSHTCFNTLLLPDYGDDYEKLAERLGRAILECEGFGLE